MCWSMIRHQEQLFHYKLSATDSTIIVCKLVRHDNYFWRNHTYFLLYGPFVTIGHLFLHLICPDLSSRFSLHLLCFLRVISSPKISTMLPSKPLFFVSNVLFHPLIPDQFLKSIICYFYVSLTLSHVLFTVLTV